MHQINGLCIILLDNVQLSVDGINFAVITPPPGGFKTVQDPNTKYTKNWEGDEMSPFDKQVIIIYYSLIDRPYNNIKLYVTGKWACIAYTNWT